MSEDSNQKSRVQILELLLILIIIIMAAGVLGLVFSPDLLAPLVPVSLDDLDPPYLLYTDGDQNIYITDQAGQRAKRIYRMKEALKIYSTAWSPDGRYIIFSAYVDGNKDLYRIDSDGSNLLRMTTNYADDIYADWSPDGAQIVFSSNRYERGWRLYLINPDGSDLRMLRSENTELVFPDWWPSGDRILFRGKENESYALYMIATNVSDEWMISDSVKTEGDRWKAYMRPAVSPDGKFISYVMNNELRLLTIQGRQDILVSKYVSDVKPAWSPDSRFLAFATPNGISILDMIDMETRRLGSLPTKSGSMKGISWGPLEN